MLVSEVKYDYNDVVKFNIILNEKIGPQELTGYIYIIDEYGTFEQNIEPSYDIMVPNLGLFKHIRQSGVEFVRKSDEKDLEIINYFR